jgi:gluconate kinase
MGAFLVTGNPGAGKSTLAEELSRRRYAAVDADELAGWESEAGDEVQEPADAGDAWRLSHRWVWRRRLVEELVAAHAAAGRDVFVCGIARNQRELLGVFDAVFLLALDDVTQVERLDTPANAHRSAALRAQIREGRAAFEREMRAAGAVAVDARLPPAVLADDVLRLALGVSAPESSLDTAVVEPNGPGARGRT